MEDKEEQPQNLMGKGQNMNSKSEKDLNLSGTSDSDDNVSNNSRTKRREKGAKRKFFKVHENEKKEKQEEQPEEEEEEEEIMTSVRLPAVKQQSSSEASSERSFVSSSGLVRGPRRSKTVRRRQLKHKALTEHTDTCGSPVGVEFAEDNNSCNFVAHFDFQLLDPLGQPTVTAGGDYCIHTCCLSVPTFQYLAKQNKCKVKTMFTTGEIVVPAEWIIDDTCLLSIWLWTFDTLANLVCS